MARLIAFYLPQFHPTENNNKWYGEGFTEWTNVCKARPLFLGHVQPHIPADLGFYDLRVEETRLKQAELAKEYGVEAFCYYYYRFSKNEHELDLPFKLMLSSGKPDFPFMVCWANETWYKKMWNKDGTVAAESKILKQQKYEGETDYIDFFYEMLPAFKDKRYLRIENKPAFMIYKPLDFQDTPSFIRLWNNLAKQNGLEGIFFIGQTTEKEKEKILFDLGFDAVQLNLLREYWLKRKSIEKVISKLFRIIFRMPLITTYKKASKYFVYEKEKEENLIPTIIPNWDHTPRTGRRGNLLLNSTPELFRRHLIEVKKLIENKPEDKSIAFIMAWNEWGEGNYLEPDLKYGKKYLETLKEVFDK